MIDLHTHSNASDGNLSPAQLVKEAQKKGISTLALTDHDTIKGLREASLASLETGMNFIPGIELEINWKENSGGEFHLLGLGIKKPSKNFTDAVDEMSERREIRNLGIVKEMNKAGIVTDYKEIKKLSGGHSVGRPHFAAFLVKKKIVRNIPQAFERYLSKGKAFFVPRITLDFERAVDVIHESEGYAILAHPMSLYLSWGKLPDVLVNLKEKGLDGIEAFHPLAKISACQKLKTLAKKLDLYFTAGSDFHGDNTPGRMLGVTSGGNKLNEDFQDETFREKLNSLIIV